ncbi:alpha/beta hydrolase [Solirubrobacter sp. CPCC 204708]|uniref:Alpha/beta hydrolase n=1 Tax=Solirubrobacter deserti TaxID=2282478 RepID=A0ABT4RK25_9ACTN|nr:alpha/beta hydrolase [Solirubrobacter deserti]MBE2316871.1 alpha/beta hydrolase [Solirubrobacter deserti]MDA0138912.1 alpha/beta hydrolase [Solirubrobacter deserti]
MGSLVVGDQRLAYTEYGSGPKLAVLLHGLLFNQRMHAALAQALAERGHRVVTLDLLGHGDSDRPADKWRYSMPAFGAQVIALLDELDADEAVLLGTSLGANVALEAAVRSPERVRALVVEMPVLDHALIGCAIFFTPVMIALTAGEPAMRGLSRLTRLVPRRRLPWQADILLDWVRQDPAPSAAVFQGLFFGRTAPPREERAAIEAPTLVIGHQYDIVHPFSDAGMLAEELPHAELMQAHSLIELRVAPKRLTNEIGRFLDECWLPRAANVRARAS